MKRILVTGATGFVGQGLLLRLIADGHSIRASVRRPRELPVETVFVDSIGPDTEWDQALEGIDTVVHLAGRAHIVRESPRERRAAFRRVNAAGTTHLAKQAERADVRRFVLISSVKAAAETTRGRPLTEQDPAASTTSYGISKWEGEKGVRAAAHNMEVVVLRPPLVYGPGVGANFRALLRLIDSGTPLPLAWVHNRRSLIARDNLVDAIATAIVSPGAAGGTFYVADSAPPLSTPALISALAASMDRRVRLLPFPTALLAAGARLMGRSDAVDSLLRSLEIDDSAFRAATGWRPPVAQEEAFRAVADWYKGTKDS